MEDRQIYLFDEWVAAQSSIFKAIFYTPFLEEVRSRGKTVLVISYGDRYFHLAGRIIRRMGLKPRKGKTKKSKK
ncbi:hypothetical protein [Desmonostoc muscorum]|uniref:hypothetical protein n=1 Tax=Desmonostoc muscorum TaxID=1179 RepID=UPI00359F4F7C